MDLPDNIYNWFLNYLSDRTHCTLFKDVTSAPASINASVVQGSVLGPSLFNLNSCALHPISADNRYFKYADDAYLVVPFANAASISQELAHHTAWAASCNLKLNPAKTSEIVFSKKGLKQPPINSGIVRIEKMTILGVIVDNRLNFQAHINEVVTSCSQSLFALRLMRQHGMPDQTLKVIFKAKSIQKLLYASQAWWGFTSKSTFDQVEGFLRRAQKFGYYDKNEPDAKMMCQKADTCLFNQIVNNPMHSLFDLLPPLCSTNYSLRERPHNFDLPRKDDRNFINRMLFVDIY